MVDVGKILTDVHHSLSLHRRYLLASIINPSLKKWLQEAPFEGFLYGESLSERIKTGQAMRKISGDILKKKKINHPSTSSLNYKRQASKIRFKPGGGQTKTRSRHYQDRAAHHRSVPTPMNSQKYSRQHQRRRQ